MKERINWARGVGGRVGQLLKELEKRLEEFDPPTFPPPSEKNDKVRATYGLPPQMPQVSNPVSTETSKGSDTTQ
ncbi:hypothetical protein A2773_05385 [Candidatus Gottesmanbacteria bacterium RIFCSPHIGHO2_01_FULL_39_10]|uniref:Uncharacterized protein n=1 Tax=Candidatus Gottesmanbacteria bacterium RIFCSPHIGHO2_01_FULL_39_10 TaxID=1798375 RepID=A0A1F5ZP96_9BACT|nr:MAG: hypothetical protein A2773_05385 [Candidatus Gottesmanbacteria bacterium RIFCSPHIGHO2_01_FULL_39_10]